MAVRSPIKETDHWFIGEDRYLEFLITETGVPLDCSTFALEFALKRNAWDDTIVLTKTTGGGQILTADGNGTDDLVRVAVQDTDTDALLSGNYFYTLRRTDSGQEVVLAYGPAWLSKAASP